MREAGRRTKGREEPDESLMALCAAGDAKAFDELFLRIHRARGRYDPVRPFAPWFFQIASRLLIDDRRRAFRGHEVPIGECDPRAERPGGEEQVADRMALKTATCQGGGGQTGGPR